MHHISYPYFLFVWDPFPMFLNKITIFVFHVLTLLFSSQMKDIFKIWPAGNSCIMPIWIMVENGSNLPPFPYNFFPDLSLMGVGCHSDL